MDIQSDKDFSESEYKNPKPRLRTPPGYPLNILNSFYGYGRQKPIFVDVGTIDDNVSLSNNITITPKGSQLIKEAIAYLQEMKNEKLEIK